MVLSFGHDYLSLLNLSALGDPFATGPAGRKWFTDFEADDPNPEIEAQVVAQFRGYHKGLQSMLKIHLHL
ncbi:MAG: hypothetical protein ACI8X5_001608 [Planctomycetota bacterium]